jgi:O-antigen ligase
MSELRAPTGQGNAAAIEGVAERDWLRWPLLLPALAAVLVVAITAAASQPKLALAAALAASVFVLAFSKPVANLAVILFLTAVVPYGVLNQYSLGGGVDSPGLLFSDIFLLAGLSWAALAWPRTPLDRRRYLFSLAMFIFLFFVAVQFLHGIRSGYGRSTVGQETRVMFALGSFLIALPLLADRPSRRRLFGALAVVALALGAWGMIQWFGAFQFGAAGDVGVRAGVAQTGSSGGQLQGGEFAYPVAIILCFAVLVLGGISSWFWRALLICALALNLAACLVTFERSFWLDAIAGLLFVAITAAGFKRLKVLSILAGVATITVVVLSLFAPSTLTTAEQRFGSLSGYGSDPSVRYRLVESGFVYERIRAHPLNGSGLGATIFWGQPWARTTPKTRNYSHNGYLWLAWKVGLPAAALLVCLLGLSLLSRAAPREEELSLAVRRGAQAAIVGLLLATTTFPSFSQLSITAVIGMLLALAISPQSAPGEDAGC